MKLLCCTFPLVMMSYSATYAGGAPVNACVQSAEDAQQANSGRDISDDPHDAVILPGFSPLSLQGNQVTLGASRVYDWGDSLFPAIFTVSGERVAKNMQLVAIVNGVERPFVRTRIQVKQSSATAVVLLMQGEVSDAALSAEVETRVEYDGVAMARVHLAGSAGVVVDKLFLRVEVAKNDFTTVMAFDPDTIRRRKKQLLYPTNYQGKFLNAVGFPNGQHSFWWFADNAEGWIWNGGAITELRDQGTNIELRQNIIGDKWRLSEPLDFRFNYLVTPVKELAGTFRRDRIAGKVNKQEGRYARYHLWWITAFAHQDFPYLAIPPELQNDLPGKDLKVYPGLKKNKELIRKWRDMGLARLPYFSAHALSGIDPALAVYRKEWEAVPPYVMPAGSDAPFTAKMAKPWLSHRAKGYTNYLICRFDELIDKLGFEGIYFDQGGVIDSKNPAHGAWKDYRGNIHPSTDILGMRNFFKRLATLFYKKGKRGDIFVHNSMSPVVPAYTFVTGMLQGEEDVIYLKNLDYIASTDLRAIRSKYVAKQYGVIGAWLSELWSPRVVGGRSRDEPKSEWVRTPRYRKAYRNFLALALLHDTSTLTMASLSDKKAIYQIYDRFGVAGARFYGYWENGISLDRPDVLISYYRNGDNTLAIVSNLGRAKYEFVPADLMRRIRPHADTSRCLIGTGVPDWGKCVAKKRYVVPQKDFLVMEFGSKK